MKARLSGVQVLVLDREFHLKSDSRSSSESSRSRLESSHLNPNPASANPRQQAASHPPIIVSTS